MQFSTKPAVSVIVPIYNSEKFICRCVDSLVNQTLKDIEILLIDDGSTDASGKLCDEYAADDSRIKVFHRTNQGVGATRQFGLDNANGTYVIHADADDWLDLDMLEKMHGVAEAEKADMVVCDYVEEYPQRTVHKMQKFQTDDSSRMLHEFLGCVSTMCWDKLVRMNVVREYDVSFVGGVDIGEDRMFNLRLIQHPLKIAYCPGVAYHYDRYSNCLSYTHFTPEKVFQRIRNIQTMRENITSDADKYSIAISEIVTACWAIRAKVFPAKEFYKVFKNLKETDILNTPGIQFYLRLAVWTAMHVSYSLAERMIAFKYWYRTKVKRV